MISLITCVYHFTLIKFKLNLMIHAFLKWSQSQIDPPKWNSLFIIIKYWVSTFTFKTSGWWVIPMTSSILNSKRVSKTTVRSIFWNWLIFSFFERVISLTWTKANKRMDPIFSKNQRKVRKLSIWFDRGPINFSEFSRGIFSFFRSEYYLLNNK